MPLGTYDELKAAIAAWLAREGDASITGNAADFVVLLEARLNRMQPGLRVTETDATLTGTVGLRTLALPTDFREAISLHRTTGGTEDALLRPFIAGSEELGTGAATPTAWAINGSTVLLDVPEAQADTFRLRYRQKLALSDGAPTNWLLTEHPDAYLFGSLVEALSFMKVAPATGIVERWQGRYGQAIAEIGVQEGRARAPAILTVDPALTMGRGGAYDIYGGA